MKSNIEFPIGFFTKTRPHAKKERKEDSIPFKWSKEVLSGKEKSYFSFCKNVRKTKIKFKFLFFFLPKD